MKNNLVLIPFDAELAEIAQPFFCDEAYRGFCRTINRMLSRSECRRLPEILGCEVFFAVLDGSKIVGIALLNELSGGICQTSTAVDVGCRKSGIASDIQECLENYCLWKKNARIVTTEVEKPNEFLVQGLLKRGYYQVGVIPEYSLIGGVPHDVFFMYKNLRRG